MDKEFPDNEARRREGAAMSQGFVEEQEADLQAMHLAELFFPTLPSTRRSDNQNCAGYNEHIVLRRDKSGSLPGILPRRAK